MSCRDCKLKENLRRETYKGKITEVVTCLRYDDGEIVPASLCCGHYQKQQFPVLDYIGENILYFLTFFLGVGFGYAWRMLQGF